MNFALNRMSFAFKTIEFCIKNDEMRHNPAARDQSGGRSCRVTYKVEGKPEHFDRRRGTTFSPKTLVNAISEASESWAHGDELLETDFNERDPPTRDRQVSVVTTVTFTLKGTGDQEENAVHKMHDALVGPLGQSREQRVAVLPAASDDGAALALINGGGQQAAGDKWLRECLRLHINRTILGKVVYMGGGADSIESVQSIGLFKLGKIEVEDEVAKFVDAYDRPRDDDHKFRSLTEDMREPSLSTLRGLAYLIREVVIKAGLPSTLNGRTFYAASEQSLFRLD